LAWQKKRAEEGSDNAQYELGVRYLTGNGVDQDEKLGKEWLEKAAKNGNPKATKKLEELSAGGGANLPGTPVITAPAPTPTPASTPSK
jgi:TPR repeat protein